MNKYQEALDDIKCRQYQDDWDNLCNAFDEDDEAIATLQELVDRETPYKPKGKFYTMKECKCKNTVYRHHKYCHECGQALYWSEDGGE